MTDLIDADTGKVAIEAGKKITPRLARKLAEEGLKKLLIQDEDLYGHFLAEEMVDASTGEVFAEAGDELNEEILGVLRDAGYTEINLLDIDHVNVGAFIRNTLSADKCDSHEQALMDIYRVMRPGEPPTRETAEGLFNGLFFDSERYDLSAVGRVKMNMRLDLDAEDTVRTLRREDILAVIQTLVGLRDGRGEIDDIDHLGNRRVRSVGELMENQFRVGLLRMERAIKERMSSVDIDTVMPHDLINAKPAAAAVREFFGSSQLSQFMDQTNPLSEITHKRRLSALGPGGLTRERAGFEVRDVHPTHYGRICPIETPEGPNIGLINSLATFARVNKYGFIESPYQRVIDGKVSEQTDYLSAMEEAKHYIAQANVKLTSKGTFEDDLILCRHSGDVLMVPDRNGLIMSTFRRSSWFRWPQRLFRSWRTMMPTARSWGRTCSVRPCRWSRRKRLWSVPAWKLLSHAIPVLRSLPGVPAWSIRSTRRVSLSGRHDETDPSKSGVDIYNLLKFQRSNQNTCINQRPLVRVGDQIDAGRYCGRRTVHRPWRSGVGT